MSCWMAAELNMQGHRGIHLTLHGVSALMETGIYQTLSALIGYRYERSRGDYDTTYYKSIYDPLSDVNQHPQMRAFDLAESDAHTAKAGINYMPLDYLNLGAALSVTAGEHIDVLIGRRNSQKESVSLAAELTPLKELLLYSQYFYNRSAIESRYSWTYDGTLSASYPADTNTLYTGFIKPVSETIEDTSNSYTIGFDYSASAKTSITGNFSRHEFTGTTVTMPAVSSATDTYELKISYRPGGDKAYNKGLSFIQVKDLRISAGYYSQTYKHKDYTLDNFPEPVDIIVADDPKDMFLGITEPEYRLNIFSLTLDFYF